MSDSIKGTVDGQDPVVNEPFRDEVTVDGEPLPKFVYPAAFVEAARRRFREMVGNQPSSEG